jgi:uncharacterized protein YcfJ
MTKTKKFLSVLALFLTVTSAFAQGGPPPPNGDGNAHYGWADVLRVDPVYGAVQQCQNQTVVTQNPANTTGGTILGAVVGGVLGSTIGRGNGRVAATAVGAVAGGAVGNQVATNSAGQTVQTYTNCGPGQQRQIMGYDVQYRYRGEVYESRLSYDPGERLRVLVNVAPAE